MVHLRRNAFDVARVRDRDDDVLVGDQVLDLHVEGLGLDFRPAFVSVLLLHLEELGLDDVQDLFSGGEDGLESLDVLLEARLLGPELLDLESGELPQGHGEDRLRLRLGQQVPARESGLGLRRISVTTIRAWSWPASSTCAAARMLISPRPVL